MLGSALFSINSLTTSVCPLGDAIFSGVQPFCGDNSNETYRTQYWHAHYIMPLLQIYKQCMLEEQ